MTEGLVRPKQAAADEAALEQAARGYKAVETLYHAYITGLVLTLATRRDTKAAADLVFRTFRRQHHEKFLPGLDKLGLRGLPDAVAAGRYHYLSNQLGGVGVEYMEESERKAWICYPPPRWIWDGTAICGIPSEVAHAILRGWHAHNGVSLGNPRMGFVCTGQTMDGQPGLSGYYYDYGREIKRSERLRFAPGEEVPVFDPALAPKVADQDWPAERRWKALRNYSMDYVRVMIPETVALFGPAEGGRLAGITGRLIGMHYFSASAASLGVAGTGPQGFAEYFTAMGRAQGDDTEWARDGSDIVVRQSSWRLMRGLGYLSPAVFEAWNELWQGAASACDRRLRLSVEKRLDQGDGRFEWRLRYGPPATAL